MSPNTRQTTIKFRVRKNSSIGNNLKKHVSSPDPILKIKSECSSPVKTPKKNQKPNETAIQLLTPASALATLLIASPEHNVKNSLNLEHGELPCREQELQELEDFLKATLMDRCPGSMYISGLPGTGKTAALTEVLKNKKISKECQTVFVNCTAVKSSEAIYFCIAEALNLKPKGKSIKVSTAVIERHIVDKKKAKMILLVLDEIDQLDSRFQSVLYRIFEWPAKKNSRLVLIGIANSVGLTDRVLPRLQTQAIKPKLLHFRPYEKDQIVKILRHRLSKTHDTDSFAPGALELISAKVAGQSGDLRRAIDLGRRVLEIAKPKTSDRQKLAEKLDKGEDSNTLSKENKNRVEELCSTPGKVKSKIHIDTSSVQSPRKRCLSLKDDANEDSMPTPTKTSRRESTILTPDKENNVRRSPRKSLQSRKSVFRKLCPEEEESPVKLIGRSPCKLFNYDISPPKSSRKQLFPNITSPSGKQIPKLRSPNVKESIFYESKEETPSKSKHTLKTPVKSTCKLLDFDDKKEETQDFKSPRKTPRKLEILATESPRKSPRKQQMIANEKPRLSPSKLMILSKESPKKSPRQQLIHASDVLSVVTQMYGSARSLKTEESSFPLHQKLLVCSLLLILTKGKNKDVTVGKLHEVYSRVCTRRGITAVDQSSFISLCRQVEVAGGVEVGRGHGRLAKVTLQWDQDEVSHALKDSSLLAAILADTSVLGKK